MSEEETLPSPDDVSGDRRVRSHTEKGALMYYNTREEHCQKLKTAWQHIEDKLSARTDPNENVKTLQITRTELNQALEDYTELSQLYREYLARVNTAESQRDLEAHTSLSKSRDQLTKNYISRLDSEILRLLETASQISESCRSSSASNISSVLARKKAKAEAAKTKLEFANKEASLKKQKAALDEKQQMISVQTTRAQAELNADLELLKTQETAATTEAEVKALELLSNPPDDLNDDLKSLILPKESAVERTRDYIENLSLVSNRSMPSTPLQPTPTKYAVLHDSTDVLGTPRPGPRFDMNKTFPIEREVSTISTHSVLPPGEFSTSALNPAAAVYNPGATYNMPQVYPNTNTTTVNTEITQFLLKKELLLTRLNNFNDQPECYASWKAGFLGIVRELNVNSTEEIDLLVKWLGPSSKKHALSLRSATVNDPARGLKLIWDRLGQRYGAPELIEHSLKQRLERFPKLTNKDNEQLYELADLLSEIESTKSDPQYNMLLSYFDTSSGVIPIVRKLPYNLQERWTTKASNYKKQHKLSFPPFRVFVEFVTEMSCTRNDPSFAYDVNVPTTPQRKDRQVTTRNISSKKTVNTSESENKSAQKCPVHHSNHTLNDCRSFRDRSYEDRKHFLRENGICYRCCASKNHMATMCKETIKCSQCKSDRHATALHVHNSRQSVYKPPETVSSDGGEKERVNSKCTQICGSDFGGKSCSKNIFVNVYPRGMPEHSKRMYAILDEQSNSSLARSQFFDMFEENGERTAYTLSSCNGRVSTSGRRAKDYVIEAIDGSDLIQLPEIVECDNIPNERSEIPTPEVAMFYPHLTDIAKSIPPLDNDSEILLLIGRDVPVAHHVLYQCIGPLNTPYAQKLRLGWVVVGETCLGKVHKPDYVVNKTFILPNGRPTTFQPCPNDFDIKTKGVGSFEGNNIFVTTPNDNKVGTSVEDRAFLEIMNEGFIKGPEGNWTVPLPFKQDRQRLPNNKIQAVRRAKILHNSLLKNSVKRQHFFEFMEKILQNGHAELAPPLKPDDECWYLPLFGVYHPKKPGKIRGVFDSSASYEGVSLNEVLLTGPDLTNSLLGVLLRFRREKIALTADIESMFYCFQVHENHRNYLRFIWYQDNDFDKGLIEYRMKVHVFGNSPSPAVATYGLHKTAELVGDKFGQDVVNFVKRDFYVDDALTSLPTINEAIDLGKCIYASKLLSSNTSSCTKGEQGKLFHYNLKQ